MRNLSFWSLASFLMLISICSYGQMESFPCKNSNPELKALFKGEVIKSLYVHDCYGPGLGNLSSSFLMPSGTPPKIIEVEGEPPDDGAYVKWTCTYSAGNISDDDPKTAWVEGVKGAGIGEVLIVPCLDLSKAVKIWSGYGKSEATFTTNSRPKTIRTVIIRADPGEPSQYGTNLLNLKVIAEAQVNLTDKNAYQPLPLPAFKSESHFSAVLGRNIEYLYLLGIELLEVYQGTKYEDTCISEIGN